MDGAALMSPDTVSRISMAFCSSSFLYSATILDSARLSRIRILRRIRLLNFINLTWRERRLHSSYYDNIKYYTYFFCTFQFFFIVNKLYLWTFCLVYLVYIVFSIFYFDFSCFILCVVEVYIVFQSLICMKLIFTSIFSSWWWAERATVLKYGSENPQISLKRFQLTKQTFLCPHTFWLLCIYRHFHSRF